jgi:hypothetical protein
MAVGLSVPHPDRERVQACGEAAGDSAERLAVFRRGFYGCLTARADALFELADAVLCTDGPVKTLVGLSLAPEHRRGHGALFDAVNAGRVDLGRLRDLLAAQPLPRASAADGVGRIVLAVDVTPWLRPEAATSPDRLFCHVYGRGKNQAQMIPGWPYSMVAAIEPGRTSWTAMLDVMRLGPDDDEQAVTARQVRGVVERLTAKGQWCQGDPDILVVFDAGYDVARLGFALRDLPVQVLGRLRSDRVFYRPAPPPTGKRGRPVRHGGAFQFKDRSTWHPAEVTSTNQTTRYGTARACAWDRMHPRLTHRAAWLDHHGKLPVLEGTVIQLQVDHLPGERDPKPLWLWTNATGLPAEQVDLLWQAFLRRFDIEHTFRFLKQTLGWTTPKLHDPAAADRWTWLLIACHTQLRLARDRTQDLRRPWEKPAPAGRLSPARVRRGFRNLHATTGSPAGAPKPGKPGPGRPPGSKNRRPATRYDVGKTAKRDKSITASKARAG